MQCKSCNTELAKHAKVCPKCGARVMGKGPKNIKVLAIAGIIAAFVGGLMPFVQNTEDIDVAYSYMNIQQTGFWYAYMLLLVASLILVAVKKEKISIGTTLAAIAVFGVSFATSPFMERMGKTAFEPRNLSDLLADGSHTIGLGTYVVAIGFLVAIIGCFIDVVKYFKKEIKVDARYLTNSMNKNLWAKAYTYRWFYLMFLPVMVMVILFYYWPMLGIRFAFTDYKIRDPYYVGISHFYDMFTKDIYFWTAFKNTLYLSIVKLFLNTGAAVIISLMLHELSNITFKKTVQTIVYLPHFMSWVVVASLFRLILSPSESGLVNTLLVQMHILPSIQDGIFFLGDSRYWVGTYFAINIWKDTGWGTILFLATLSGISPELYEAAQIDGANRWNRMRFITLPALSSTIITVFILNLAKVMNLFESVFVLQNDSVYDVSNVIQTFIYNKTFGTGVPNYGYTTAVGLFKSLIGMTLVLSCNYASKKVRGRGIV